MDSPEFSAGLLRLYETLEVTADTSFATVEEKYRELRSFLINSRANQSQGHATSNLLPLIDDAFATLKEAQHKSPSPTQASRQHPSRPLRPGVSNAPHKNSGAKLAQQSIETSTVVVPNAIRGKEPLAGPMLKINPEYTPQNQPSDWSSRANVPGFAIEHRHKNVFDALEDRAVLIHSVSCRGVWGTGIAFQIKRRLPRAFEVYMKNCRDFDTRLLGKCLLIPPQPADYEGRDRSRILYSPRVWVACLFTSKGYGRKQRGNPGRGKPAEILTSTKTALADFREQLEAYGQSNFDPDTSWKTDDEKPGRLLSVKFNSGNFGVPWNDTELTLAEVFGRFERPWFVFDETTVSEPQTKGLFANEPWLLDEDE